MSTRAFESKSRQHLLPVLPAFGVDYSAIWQAQEKLASLIFNIDKIVCEQPDLLVDSGALKAMDCYRGLWHFANDAGLSFCSLDNCFKIWIKSGKETQ